MDRYEAEATRAAGGAAFPTAGYADGMTLLDWFAGQFLAGMMAGRAGTVPHPPEAIAKAGYQYAAAMLAERKRVAG